MNSEMLLYMMGEGVAFMIQTKLRLIISTWMEDTFSSIHYTKVCKDED